VCEGEVRLEVDFGRTGGRSGWWWEEECWLEWEWSWREGEWTVVVAEERREEREGTWCVG